MHLGHPHHQAGAAITRYLVGWLAKRKWQPEFAAAVDGGKRRVVERDVVGRVVVVRAAATRRIPVGTVAHTAWYPKRHGIPVPRPTRHFIPAVLSSTGTVAPTWRGTPRVAPVPHDGFYTPRPYNLL